MDRKVCMFVRWQDAKGCHSEWQHLEDVEGVKPTRYIVESVGFVIRESDDVLHLAPHLHTHDSGGHYVGDMQIPVCCIVESWEIE